MKVKVYVMEHSDARAWVQLQEMDKTIMVEFVHCRETVNTEGCVEICLQNNVPQVWPAVLA